MKGLSNVVVTILMMLLVVAATGAFFLWSNRFQQDASAGGGEQMTKYTESAASMMNIESVSNCSIYVRNTGSQDIASTNINVLIDSRSIIFNSSSATIRKGLAATLRINQNFTCGKDECNVEVLVPSMQSVSVAAGELNCTVYA